MEPAQTQSRSIVPGGMPFTYHDLVRSCRMIMYLVRVVTLGDHQVTLHGMLPVWHPATGTHTHPIYEAQLLLEGTADCYTHDHRQSLVPGQVTLHAPGVPHRWPQQATPFLRITLLFSITPAPSMPSVIQWPFQPHTFATLHALLEDVSTHVPGWCDRVEPQVALLLSRLLTLTDWPGAEIPDGASDASFLFLLDRLLDDNLHLHFSRRDIANYLGMSERTLTRKLHQHTGGTLSNYVESLRLNRACRLLLDTRDTVEVISQQVGYSTSSYFCHRFLHYFGVTPRQFRQQNLQHSGE